MVNENLLELTEDEAELYDRQIRLWGMDSQKRLRNAKILIIGLQGFGAEVGKNIILSGVQSVTFLDHVKVSVNDSCAQFLVPTESIGENRAEASIRRAQALNPMVKVTADADNVADKPDEFFGDFDVVIATCCSLAQLKRINTACRLRNAKFFCGDVYGMFGYFFADLLIHEYVEEKDKNNSVKKVKTFVPLVETVTVDWTQPELSRRLNKMDPSCFLMLVLHEFRKRYGRVPDRLQREADIDKLKELSDSVLKELSVPSEKIPVSLIGRVFAEVSPVCAIVGGVLAQEVIKTVSQKEAPINNYFFFNPDKCCGFIETIANAV